MNEIEIQKNENNKKNIFNQTYPKNRITYELKNDSYNENDINQTNYEERKLNSDNNISYDEDTFEEDTEREAVEFIQLQHQKIKKLKKELEEKNEIINEYKGKFNKLNYRNKDEKENMILNKNLRQQIEILNKEKEELKLEIYSKDKLIKELKIDLNELSKKFNKYNNNMISQNEEKSDKVNQLLQVIKEYSNQMKINEDKIKIYENENKKLNQNLTNEMKELQKLKILYENKINEDKNWISQINQDIKLLCDWISNYLGTFFPENIEIQEVPKFTQFINPENLNNYNKINLNLLRQTITEARNKIYDKQNKYENTIKLDKKEQIELLYKIESQNKNITILNNDIISLKEELAKKKFEIEEMNNKFNNSICSFLSIFIVFSYLFCLSYILFLVSVIVCLNKFRFILL